MSELRFYFDENVDPEVAKQLQQKGIEAVSVRDLKRRGDKDMTHLQRALEMGYVVCTYDKDFLRMNAQRLEHAGIIFAQHDGATIGGWVRELQKLHTELTADEMVGQVKFVSVK